MTRARTGGLVALPLVAALIVSGCSVSTTSSTTVAPVDPISSESPAPELDLQLRPVLDVGAADPARCPTGVAATTPPAKEPASLCSADRRAVYSLGPAALTGPRVTSIEPLYSATGVVVQVKVDAMGKNSLSNVTLESSFKTPPQSQLAIGSHGTVLVAPAVTEQIDGGVLLLTGFASMDAARSTVDFITR